MARKKSTETETEPTLDETQPEDVDTDEEGAQPDAEPEKPVVEEEAKKDAEDPQVPADESFKAVNPGIPYSKTMMFPVEVVLPLYILAEVGAPHRRYQILSSNQPVPEAIINWLKDDIRYSRWFI